MNKNNKLYTIIEAAKRMNITPQAVRYRIKHKMLDSVLICGARLVTIEGIKDYLERRFKGKRKRLGK